jgi:hypothetical protein
LTFPNQDASHNFNTYFVNIANDLILKTYGENESEDKDFNRFLPERNMNELSDISFTHSCYVRSKNAKSSSSSSPLKNSQKFAKIRLINYLDINFDFLMNSLDAVIITLLNK